jgi:Ni,Fe-hydrogenase I large subunit
VGRKEGKYSFAKSPRYDVPGHGYIPVEVGHVARSCDSCLVCTVHAYDGKGRELSKFVINGQV